MGEVAQQNSRFSKHIQHIKKVSDTVLNTSSQSFKKAFLIQYPSKGIWVIAFQSGDYRGEAESIIGEETINLFVPTTPNPTSGFFVLIPKKMHLN